MPVLVAHADALLQDAPRALLQQSLVVNLQIRVWLPRHLEGDRVLPDQESLADAHDPDRIVFSQGSIEGGDSVILAGEDDVQIGQHLVHALPMRAGAQRPPVHFHHHRHGAVNWTRSPADMRSPKPGSTPSAR